MSHFLDRLDKNLLISLFKFFLDDFCETNRRIVSSTTFIFYLFFIYFHALFEHCSSYHEATNLSPNPTQ